MTRDSGKLLAAMEAAGLDRAALGEALASSVEPLAWPELVALLERASSLAAGDSDRLRDVGRALVARLGLPRPPSAVEPPVSPKTLYEAALRWLIPAQFPEIALDSTSGSRTRLEVRATIREPHAACEAFFHVGEGVLLALPDVIGAPPARLHRRRVTPRFGELVIELPPPSGEHVALADDLASAHRTTLEIQALFDGIPDLVIIHRGGVILWTNRAVLKTLGYTSDEAFVGRPMLDHVAPDSREVVARRMRSIEEGKTPELMEVSVLASDGSPRPVELAASQVVTFRGQPSRLVVGRDVTERVRLQQELLVADRMESIGMLAAGVAHEVNNPLAYVLNNIEIAMKSLAPLGESTAQSRQALGVALEGVDHIRTIVRDLLLLSRADEGPLGIVDVRAVVESTLTLASRHIAERAKITRDYLASPFVRGTEARIGQVVLNLIANAMDAMAPRSREANVLRVGVDVRSEGMAVIEVEDNGGGIAPEHAKRVFEPFFTTKPQGQGTGLGLSISQRLVAELGGELSFEPGQAGGTVFRVTLPSADPST